MHRIWFKRQEQLEQNALICSPDRDHGIPDYFESLGSSPPTWFDTPVDPVPYNLADPEGCYGNRCYHYVLPALGMWCFVFVCVAISMTCAKASDVIPAAPVARIIRNSVARTLLLLYVLLIPILMVGHIMVACTGRLFRYIDHTLSCFDLCSHIEADLFMIQDVDNDSPRNSDSSRTLADVAWNGTSSSTG